ncbi:outer membrane protein OmpA-like peptidoglycan-associated protein [Leeuwenhoekiella aestuarii]|uniref:Outer membrane protein OmpA-like peptidoglycan-associated protein n=1 Tax=Leeuwenhoekiella aestuarii TaxID=2249426 RepID=A0A4Q0NX75_9FLAO|nr:OmpA family protein [Leeuwenhoekiella aestuarii]RXG15821.1 outer membrane protein OmpA-like peptidoglycan-associated protein [Leeuwenhoekiella aestuarii]RXG16498.1 outer membrane protein OmpA-like peptidoglycan-associated protein [Leeuwenhoekiella aestuarii]
MKRIYLIIICLVSLNVVAQNHLEKANEFYDRLVYIDAAKEFEAYVENANYIEPETYMKIGDTYYNLKNFAQSKEAYQKWYNTVGPNTNSTQGYQYYDSLRRLKLYDEAEKVAERYFKAKSVEALNNHYEERDRFEDLLRGDTLYKVRNLDFNSQYADFGGSFNQTSFVFTSGRNYVNKGLYERDDTPYLSIYKTENPESDSADAVELFSKQLTSEFHDGTATFSPNSKYLYYASSYQTGNRKVFEKGKKNYFKIYRVDMSAKKYKKELLSFNGDTYSTGQPYVTPDGKKLFFASDMPGGYGKADIYVCDIYEDGTYSKPMNLGPNINTIVDDFFPFFKDDILYFSSGGHVGFGGLDMYKSYYRDGIYGVAINLGPIINTNADDFAYLEGIEPNTGYFSSDRAGGKGGDDIYAFEYNLPKCVQYISGTVYDIETNEPIAGAYVTVYDESNTEYIKVKTNEKGAYAVELTCGSTYKIEARKAGFSEDQLNFTTDVLPNLKMDMLDFRLKDLSEIFVTEGEVEKIRIDPIYFEYYRYNITDVAAIQLRKVVDAMKAYPEMIIKIESHTDQRGTDYFNKTLSTNRALSTKEWLLDHGIEPSRIESAIGYGESRPINICDEDGKTCTELEYSENRRSEFIVVSR